MTDKQIKLSKQKRKLYHGVNELFDWDHYVRDNKMTNDDIFDLLKVERNVDIYGYLGTLLKEKGVENERVKYHKLQYYMPPLISFKSDLSEDQTVLKQQLIIEELKLRAVIKKLKSLTGQ